MTYSELLLKQIVFELSFVVRCESPDVEVRNKADVWNSSV